MAIKKRTQSGEESRIETLQSMDGKEEEQGRRLK